MQQPRGSRSRRAVKHTSPALYCDIMIEQINDKPAALPRTLDDLGLLEYTGHYWTPAYFDGGRKMFCIITKFLTRLRAAAPASETGRPKTVLIMLTHPIYCYDLLADMFPEMRFIYHISQAKGWKAISRHPHRLRVAPSDIPNAADDTRIYILRTSPQQSIDALRGAIDGFFADIRSNVPEDDVVNADNIRQLSFAQTLNVPAAIKFRLPFGEKEYKYVSGEYWLQPHGPYESAETRVYLENPTMAQPIIINAAEYEAKMCYYNNVSRVFHAYNNIYAGTVSGFDYCASCCLEADILVEYQRSQHPVQTEHARTMNPKACIKAISKCYSMHSLCADGHGNMMCDRTAEDYEALYEMFHEKRHLSSPILGRRN